MQSAEHRTILIVARDPIIGALMGELVNLCGYHAHLPNSDERPLAALHRLRPDCVLIDADHAGFDFINEASAVAPVVFFSGGMSERELERFAKQRHALSFPLPNGPRKLSETLELATH